MTRGRKRSKTDEAATTALAGIREYLAFSRISPTALAGKIQASPSSVLRALSTEPPGWSPTFKKINDFVLLQIKKEFSAAHNLSEHVRSFQGTCSAHATAALLRAVADLLEKQEPR